MAASCHAEIVGAGFGGLVAAIGLAERGWSVRVHERRDELREAGYGIAIQDNMVRVFEALGVSREVLAGGMVIDRRDSMDGRANLLLSMRNGLGRHRISRHHIVTRLAARARGLGVEIVTGSPVAEVQREGAVVTERGGRHTADLVVVCDGINSRFAERLGLLDRIVRHRCGAVRVTIPRTASEIAADSGEGTVMVEAWSQRRRILYCPNTPEELYVILTCRTGDEAGKRLPLDMDTWARAFPGFADLLVRTHDEADWQGARWAQFQTVHLKRWSVDRVAVLGDAAHAMPPFLGQGAGHAMMNALGLAVAMEGAVDPRSGLVAWEARERPLTAHTQRWTQVYGLPLLLPGALKPLAIRAEHRLPWLAAQYARAANRLPSGCEERN